MALTRVTSTVLGSNAVSAEKMANGSITTRLYGIKSIEAAHFATSANAFSLTTNINLLTANINQTTANIAAAALNIAASTGNTVSLLANVNLNAANTIQLQINLKANVNSVKANVDAAEANIAGILDGSTFTGQVNMSDDLVVQGNLTVLGDSITANTINAVIQDRFLMLANSVTGSPSADIGIFMNRGSEGNAAIFYDESAKSFTMAETRDPDSNVVVSPTSLANLAVGTLKYNGADLNTAITDNRSGAISTVYKDNLTVSRALASDGSGKIAVSDVTSTELGYLDGVSSALQTQLDTKISITASAANDFITFTRLNANLNVVSSNVAGAITAAAANDFITFTRLTANLNLVSSNVALGLKQLINVAASATGEGTGSNNFYVATPGASNPTTIDNVVVSINGITQAKTTDYIYTPASGKVTFTDAAIPSGLTVQIITLNPPS